jgi:hypothetical protein
MQAMSDIIEYQEMHFWDTFWNIVGLLVDPTKIAIIVNLPPPKSVCQLRATMGHTVYYKKFIKGYA